MSKDLVGHTQLTERTASPARRRSFLCGSARRSIAAAIAIVALAACTPAATGTTPVDQGPLSGGFATPGVVLLGTPITFSSNLVYDPDGVVVSWFWNFGDGATSTAADQAHTYASVGNYTATLLATDNDGGSTLFPVNVTVVAAPTGAAGVSTGAQHTCVAMEDQSVRCWGLGKDGELGNGTPNGSTTPVHLPGLAGVVSVSAGAAHSCAVLADGTARCWGANASGQLGDGTTTDRLSPVAVTGLSGVAEIATGAASTCARLTNATVKCWGDNSRGQLGAGTTTNATGPIAVSGLAGVTGIDLHDANGCARLSSGVVKCWGPNDLGQLGSGAASATPGTSPVVVSGLADAIDVAVGTSSCAVRATGSVACWGGNASGELGASSAAGFSATPVTVSGINTAAQVASGNGVACARLAAGTAQCWGRNDHGQLGDGTNTGRSAPAPVLASAGVPLAGVTDLDTSGDHTCARLSVATVRCWGSELRGQLGNGSFTDSPVPVSVYGIRRA